MGKGLSFLLLDALLTLIIIDYCYVVFKILLLKVIFPDRMCTPEGIIHEYCYSRLQRKQTRFRILTLPPANRA